MTADPHTQPSAISVSKLSLLEVGRGRGAPQNLAGNKWGCAPLSVGEGRNRAPRLLPIRIQVFAPMSSLPGGPPCNSALKLLGGLPAPSPWWRGASVHSLRPVPLSVSRCPVGSGLGIAPGACQQCRGILLRWLRTCTFSRAPRPQ